MSDTRQVSLAFQIDQARSIKRLEAENARFRGVLQLLIGATEADDFAAAKAAAVKALLKSKPPPSARSTRYV